MNTLIDGFYLSIYSCVNQYLNNAETCLRHDHNMTLWKKQGDQIELLHHWEFERITGLKHHRVSFFDTQSAVDFINMLLKKYDLCLSDIIAIFGTPELSNVSNYYNKDLGAEYTYHSLAHLFSSIMIDTDLFFNEEILALSVDGGSDSLIDNEDYRNRYDFLCAYSRKGTIDYDAIPSPGVYWELTKEITGMEEGSIMALATATPCRTLETLFADDDIPETYRVYTDNPYKFIQNLYQRIQSYTKADLGIKYDFYDDRFTDEENKISIMGKIVQEISIRQIHAIIETAIKKYDLDPSKVNISLSGGYALNCPTNTYIMDTFKFKKQLIAPCVNDGGQAVGIGLYYFFKNGGSFHFKLKHPYYGDEDYDMSVLGKEPYCGHIDSVYHTLEHFTDDIQNAPIVWFDGQAEIGPRALGHRSILADPTKTRSKDLLNQYKARQWWRPVAPIILLEEVDAWFVNAFESPYMLNNFVLKEEKASAVPAIIHMDQTARVQTIDGTQDDRLYNCMRDHFKATGIPLLCNTSLNDKGEPIINTIEEALNFSLRKGITVIYINGTRVALKDHELFSENAPCKRNDHHFTKNKGDLDLKMDKYDYLDYFSMADLFTYDIINDKDIRTVKRILKVLREQTR